MSKPKRDRIDPSGEPTATKDRSVSCGHVRVESVSKVFRSHSGRGKVTTALHEVDLEIRPGEFVSLLGPSGCGKSTLLEIVAGLQEPTAGRVLVDGAPVTAPGPARTVVFQHFALFPWLSALDNVGFPLRLAGSSRSDRREAAEEALRTVGLSGFGDHHISQLSGGMQQRVALARALVCDPSVLLMDEPFSGADAITREVLQEEFQELQRRKRNTVLFVTHSVDEALHLSDRVVVLGTHPGRIIQEFRLDRAQLDGLDAREREAALSRPKAECWELLKSVIAEAGTYR